MHKGERYLKEFLSALAVYRLYQFCGSKLIEVVNSKIGKRWKTFIQFHGSKGVCRCYNCNRVKIWSRFMDPKFTNKQITKFICEQMQNPNFILLLKSIVRNYNYVQLKICNPELSCGSCAAHVPCFSHSWVHRLLGWFLQKVTLHLFTCKHWCIFIPQSKCFIIEWFDVCF